MSADYRIVTGVDLPPDLDEDRCLFLQPHDKIDGQWKVNSFDARYRKKMGKTISRYKAVSPFGYAAFAERAAENGYEIVFLEDPTETFDWFESLNDAPGVTINSNFPDTIGGLLPFQVQGINFAKNKLAAVFQWSTGTGKTVGASAMVKYHRERENFDICLYVVKSHYKIGTQRALKALTDIDATVLRGLPDKRDTTYIDLWNQIQAGERPVVVMHYETFRNDKEALLMLTEGQRVFAIFDEMPNKLKNRDIDVYRALVEVLYTSFSTYKGVRIYKPIAGCERPSELRTLMLSATPIENSPEDWFNCVRIMAPDIYGAISKFHKRFVVRKNRWHQPVTWQDEDLIGAMAAHITHQVDKDDPDIAAQFPDKRPPEAVLIELDEDDQRIYDSLSDEYDKLVGKDESLLSQSELLAAITVLQMICSNPVSVLNSSVDFGDYQAELEKFVDAERPTEDELKVWSKRNKQGSEVAHKLVMKVGPNKFDDMRGKKIRCAKLKRLKRDIETHDGKMVVFTRMNASLLPLISAHMESWGVGHVVFHGSLTEKQKQAAIDGFKGDPDIKVFLSSDSGSDSINLEEADFGIHYDLPQKWSTMTQRENRYHRLTSTHAQVRTLRYAVPNSVEDRTYEIVERKKGYHQRTFKGEIAEQAIQMRRSDLLYILTGRSAEDDNGK